MLTVADVLYNAQHNLNQGIKTLIAVHPWFVLAQHQLNNAIKAIENSYGLDDEWKEDMEDE